MGSRIKYEWKSNLLDNGDIEDSDYHDTFLEAFESSLEYGNDTIKDGSIELVKYYMDGEDIDGDTFAVLRVVDYPNQFSFSKTFDDGSKIPQKHIKELTRALKKLVEGIVYGDYPF